MGYIALYWGVMLVGYFLGSKNRNNADKFNFISKIMTVSICLLVVLMGLRMGADKEVFSNLGSIGFQALVITIVLMIGAVVSVRITRGILSIDKYGDLKKKEMIIDESKESKKENEEEKSSNALTYLIIIFVIVGLVIGHFIIEPMELNMDDFTRILGIVMTVGLCIMLGFIGFDMGLTGKVVTQFKEVGLRILAFPIAILIGTTIAAILISLVIPLSTKETLAVSYGFGWYTFAPIAISGEGYTVAGAVSFMHNVFRELGGIVLIPILAKKVGYIEVTSLPGVAAMDICMPIVERSTKAEIIPYTFIIGLTESLMVPILVPLVIGG